MFALPYAFVVPLASTPLQILLRRPCVRLLLLDYLSISISNEDKAEVYGKEPFNIANYWVADVGHIN